MRIIDNADAPNPVGQPIGQVGISTGDIFEEMTPSQIEDYMTDVAALGVKRVRIDLKWDDTQRSQGKAYNWTRLHIIIDAADQHDIIVGGIINSVPRWAAASNCPEPWKCAPKDAGSVAAMAAFAGAVVKEFPTRIARIEVANEPNSMPDYFKNPERYLTVYRAIHAAVKAADSDIRVLPGGTAAIGTSSDTAGLSAPDWYRRLFEAEPNLGDIIDGLAMHPYTWPATPAGADPFGSWAQIGQVYDLLKQAGAATQRIDITEMGFPTGGPKRPTTKRYPLWESERPVSENNQAQFLNDTFQEFYKLREQGVVNEIDVFSLRDHKSSDNKSTEAHYGLTRTDGSHKGQRGHGAWDVVHAYALAE